MNDTRTLTITRLGHYGDGMAEMESAGTESGPLAVPYTLPGEIINLLHDLNGEQSIEVVTASPERVVPICPLFTICGGCTTQHMSSALAHGWMRERITETLRRAGLDAEVARVIDASGEGRRRVTWHVRWQGNTPVAGLMKAKEHHLIPVPYCPVLVEPLRETTRIAETLATCLNRGHKPLDVQITATDNGLDVDIRGYGKETDSERMALVARASRLSLARLSMHGTVLLEASAPMVRMGAAHVPVPPGGFLQATQAGEDVLGGYVREGLAGCKRVADLFAGCGPFTLRLAQHTAVHAVETHAPALEALTRAVRQTQGLKPVTTEVRDLFRRPLLAKELSSYDGIVIDPPRAGAQAQIRELALAKPLRVVMISCDMATFARDAATLTAAGYMMSAVTPIDQFRYTSHVEMCATFTHTSRMKRK